MTPTSEQSAIIEAAKTTKDNLLISALAGAAKTSTLVMIAQALPVQPVLSLAFNKRIATEMSERLPGHVSCKTLNSVGHTIWARACAKRIVVDMKKSYTLAREVIDDLPKGRRAEAGKDLSDILKMISSAKLNGVVPRGKFTGAKPLTTFKSWLDTFEEEPSDVAIEVTELTLIRSIKAAYDGRIDFDDQIYMPTLFGGTFPRFPLVLVDEAQDLSPLNHAMLRKLVTSRIIAVGDPNQSIYAFRGAMTSGMEYLRETFSMVEFPLSVTFRCPQAIVRRAWDRVPSMRWFEGAIDGSVIELEEWTPRDILDNSAIICRNNAPLFKTALDLLRGGRGVKLVGADIGPGLVKILRSLGSLTMAKEHVYDAINRWEAEKLAKARRPGSISDRAECLRVFAAAGANLSAAIAYAEHLFQSQGPIQLLSGHKSKGLEWDIVYHLDPWRIPSQFAESPEEIEQELNIKYVIETRAKRTLYLINRDDFSHA